MIQSVVIFQSRKVSFGTLFDSQSVKFDPSLFGKQTILLTKFDIGMLFHVYSKIHQSNKQKCVLKNILKTFVEMSYSRLCLPWTLLTVDNSQPWTASKCTLHFGAKTLLTMDNSLNCGPWTPFHGTKVHFLSLPWTVDSPQFFFSNFSFLHFIFSYFYNF